MSVATPLIDSLSRATEIPSSEIHKILEAFFHPAVSIPPGAEIINLAGKEYYLARQSNGPGWYTLPTLEEGRSDSV